jgi:hypothetical protein
MSPGEIVVRIIARTVALVEATLGNLVNVTNVSGNVTPSLLPSGETFVGYLSNLVEGMASGMASLLSTIMSYVG